MMVSVNISSYASVSSSDTSSIIISGLKAGVTSTAYRIAVVNINENGQIMDPMYSWESSVQTWIDSNYPDYSDIEDFAELDETTDADILSAFYSALAAAIKSGEISITTYYETSTEGEAEYPVTDDNLNATGTFSDVSMGLYVIITENGYRSYMPSAVAVVPSYNSETTEWSLNTSFTAEVKSSTLQIAKSVTDTEIETDNYATNVTINYTVVADVPTYLSDSLSTIYTITDSTSGGLVISVDSIKIYGITGGFETELSTGAYTISYTYDTDGNVIGYTINFDYDEISSYDSVEVTYSAYLLQTEATVVGPDGNTNISKLTYSNNPYDETSTGTTISDGALVYTYGIELTKVDKSNTNTTLTGAQFNLLDSDNNVLYFIKVDDGTYYLSSSSVSGSTITLEVNEDGVLYVYGLDEGTYYLQETVAPDGYVLDSSLKSITLTDADSSGELDGILDSNDDDSDGVYEVVFTNSDGFTLPVTGGIGSIVFIIAGVCLIALGIVLKTHNKKKEV